MTLNQSVMGDVMIKIKVVVLIADGTKDGAGDAFVRNGVQVNNPLNVYLGNDSTIVGTATHEWDGNNLLATFEFNDTIDVKLIPYLYPGVFGQIITRVKSVIERCHVTHLVVHCSPNADSRIQRFGYYKEMVD